MRAIGTNALRLAEEAIRVHGHGLPIDALRAALRLSTQLRTRRVPDAAVVHGASRIGGRPDLPPSVEWPRWEGFAEPDYVLANGTRVPQGCKPSPLSFLAQLALADLPDATGMLPERGWLYFFYDAEQQPWGFDPRHRGCARVIYVEGEPSSLVRTDAPPGAQVFAPTTVTSEVVGTLPSWTHEIGVKLERTSDDVYKELVETHLPGEAPHHRLLGWPKQIQGEMDHECQLVTNGINCGDAKGYDTPDVKRLEAGVKDWVMLFQLDSDEDGPGWSWGDVGCVYFWIRKQDLAERRFERCWSILQCT